MKVVFLIVACFVASTLSQTCNYPPTQMGGAGASLTSGNPVYLAARAEFENNYSCSANNELTIGTASSIDLSYSSIGGDIAWPIRDNIRFGLGQLILGPNVNLVFTPEPNGVVFDCTGTNKCLWNNAKLTFSIPCSTPNGSYRMDYMMFTGTAPAHATPSVSFVNCGKDLVAFTVIKDPNTGEGYVTYTIRDLSSPTTAGTTDDNADAHLLGVSVFFTGLVSALVAFF